MSDQPVFNFIQWTYIAFLLCAKHCGSGHFIRDKNLIPFYPFQGFCLHSGFTENTATLHTLVLERVRRQTAVAQSPLHHTPPSYPQGFLSRQELQILAPRDL